MGVRTRVTVLLLAATLGVGGATQAASGATDAAPPGTAAATKKLKCKKGFSAHRVDGRFRCLKRPRCKASQTIKLRKRKLVCVARKKPVPAPTPAPAPQPAPTPAPAPAPAADPKERARALIAGKLFTRYTTTASASGSGTSRDTRYAFCPDSTYRYSYEFTSDIAPYRRDQAAGTWVVSAAEFNDQAGAMRAVLDYTVQETNTPEIVPGQLLVEALGDKVLIGGEEFGVQAVTC